MEVVKCEKCGEEITEGKFCPNCGTKVAEKVIENSKNEDNNVETKQDSAVNQDLQNQKITLNKSTLIVLLAVIIGLVVGFILYRVGGLVKEENAAIKVDISMTSYYGHIDYILEELGLDFDLVTMGANCYTGVQKNEFVTEKYGILHTEFRYCKTNYTTIFRVYNDERDQPLREPKAGELARFDSYGKKISSSTY